MMRVSFVAIRAKNGSTDARGPISSAALTTARTGETEIDGADLPAAKDQHPAAEAVTPDRATGRSAGSAGRGEGTSSSAHRSIRMWISSAVGIGEAERGVRPARPQEGHGRQERARLRQLRARDHAVRRHVFLIERDYEVAGRGSTRGSKESGAPSSTSPRAIEGSIAQEIAASVPPSECPERKGVSPPLL